MRNSLTRLKVTSKFKISRELFVFVLKGIFGGSVKITSEDKENKKKKTELILRECTETSSFNGATRLGAKRPMENGILTGAPRESLVEGPGDLCEVHSVTSSPLQEGPLGDPLRDRLRHPKTSQNLSNLLSLFLPVAPSIFFKTF